MRAVAAEIEELETESSPVPCRRGTEVCAIFAEEGSCSHGSLCVKRHFSAVDPSRGDLRAMRLGAFCHSGLVCSTSKRIIMPKLFEDDEKPSSPYGVPEARHGTAASNKLDAIGGDGIIHDGVAEGAQCSSTFCEDHDSRLR